MVDDCVITFLPTQARVRVITTWQIQGFGSETIVGKPLFTNSSIIPCVTGVQFSLERFVSPPLSYMKQIPFESAGIRLQNMLKLAVLPDCLS